LFAFPGDFKHFRVGVPRILFFYVLKPHAKPYDKPFREESNLIWLVLWSSSLRFLFTEDDLLLFTLSGCSIYLHVIIIDITSTSVLLRPYYTLSFFCTLACVLVFIFAVVVWPVLWSSSLRLFFTDADL
jgi:hypothetical protein